MDCGDSSVGNVLALQELISEFYPQNICKTNKWHMLITPEIVIMR